MKKSSYFILILTLLVFSGFAIGQKKSKTPVKRTSRTLVRTIPEPKIETENWEEFDSKELNLKLVFPKPPTVTENNYKEAGRVEVKSSVVQTYINTDYYMVEVREYPKDFLPERNDLGENYGLWLKTFVLSRVKITSEKTVSFGRYKLVEFIYQQTANEVLIHRALVVGQKLFQIIVQFEIKKPETIEQTIERNKNKIDKFFLSFELTENEFTS